MEQDVQEMVEKGMPQSEVLAAAEESDDYRRVPEEDSYEVFVGPDYLLIGVQGEGLYTEDVSDKDFDYGHRFSCLEQDPWEGARETIYSFEGSWREVLESVEKVMPEDVSYGPGETGYAELTTDRELEKQSVPGFQMYIHDEDGEAMIDFGEEEIILREKGSMEVPSLEQLDDLSIREVTRIQR